MSTIPFTLDFLRRWVALMAVACAVILSSDAGSVAQAEDDGVSDLLATIKQADDRDYPVEQVRTAWARLADCTAETIPHILDSIDDAQSLVTVNWLSTALDRIAERGIDNSTQDTLKTVVNDATRSGYARRLALVHLERANPGYEAAFIAAQLGDPEFGVEAVAAHAATAQDKLAAGDKAAAIGIYRNAFARSTDFDQAVEIAEKLKELKVEVPLVEHLGLLVDWHLIGPFPGKKMTACQLVYPPERQVDLSRPVTFEGKSYEWQHVALGDSEWRFDLKKLLADENDCVAFAYAKLLVPEEREVELRAGADDTLAVWHNGRLVFSFPHFGNHLHADRHRVPLRLCKGENTLLLKVAEAVIVPGRVGGGPKKWEFTARLVDANGHGVTFPTCQKQE